MIIVSNHPFGLLDGLIISSIVSNIRTDYKILINEEITQIDLIKKYLLPIKFSEITEDIKGNIKSKKNAIKFVNDGGLLILFPSGEVATSKFIFENPIGNVYRHSRISQESLFNYLEVKTFSPLNKYFLCRGQNVLTCKYIFFYLDVKTF